MVKDGIEGTHTDFIFLKCNQCVSYNLFQVEFDSSDEADYAAGKAKLHPEATHVRRRPFDIIEVFSRQSCEA